MYCHRKMLSEVMAEHQRAWGQIGGNMYFIRELVALGSL
jgi:hypothetical protein